MDGMKEQMEEQVLTEENQEDMQSIEESQEPVAAVIRQAENTFSKLGLMFLAGSAMVYAAQLLVNMIVERVNPALMDNVTISLLLSVASLYLVGMPILILLVKKIPGQAPEKRKMKAGQFVLALIMCYTVMYLSNFVGTIITAIIGAVKGQPVDNALMEIATNANMGVTFVYMVICAPIMEEYVFRKLIVDRTARYGQGVAIFVSGLMFGLFHGNLSQFVYATTLGMFFAFLYIKTGKLKITIALHMFINFMGAVVSVLVLKAVRYEELLEISASANPDELMNFVMNNLGGWLIYILYICLIFGAVIAGIVLFIVFRKRFFLVPGEVQLPKEKRFGTIFLNFGMAAYCLFWIGMIIVQLIQ